jgi:hypothetical protein
VLEGKTNKPVGQYIRLVQAIRPNINNLPVEDLNYYVKTKDKQKSFQISQVFLSIQRSVTW